MPLARLDLNALAVFASVVQEKGFTAAARRLAMSKSAVSKLVAQLEDQTGVRLLQRTTRRLSLTDAGAALYEHCTRIVSEADQAILAINQLQAQPRGLLRVSAPLAFGARHLGVALAQFGGRYPDVQLNIELSDRFVDLIDEGFDVAVRIARLPDSTMFARKLCAMPTIALAAPAYLAVHDVPEHPRALTHHNCLLYSYAAAGDAWPFRDNGQDIAVHVRGSLRTNNGDVMLAAAKAGLGIAVLPAFIADADLSCGALVEVLGAYRAQASAVYAVYPHNRHLSTKVRAFVDFLAAHFAGFDWLARRPTLPP